MSSEQRVDQEPANAPTKQLSLFLAGVFGALVGFLVSWYIVPHSDSYLGAYPLPLIFPLLVLGSGAGCLIAAIVTRFLQWLMPGKRKARVTSRVLGVVNKLGVVLALVALVLGTALALPPLGWIYQIRLSAYYNSKLQHEIVAART